MYTCGRSKDMCQCEARQNYSLKLYSFDAQVQQSIRRTHILLFVKSFCSYFVNPSLTNVLEIGTIIPMHLSVLQFLMLVNSTKMFTFHETEYFFSPDHFCPVKHSTTITKESVGIANKKKYGNQCRTFAQEKENTENSQLILDV